MKPLKKPKTKFKDKIKSFFKVDLEKDLQEEECTKVFEKVPLVTLTRNKIFIAIFLFLIIVNTLVGFNINYFYIRAILGFLFLIIVPGLLIMLMLKIREVGFWEYLVYTVGLSVSFIMFGGLAVNWILPWLNITDKPLSLWPILICFNIFLIGFWLVAYIRNNDFKPLKIQYPKLDTTNRIFFITPMLFPILSILGAFLLNNHGTNILTMILLGAIAVYVFMIVLFRKKLNPNVYPWAILLIAISVLLASSLRSWYVSGVDTNLEYQIFQLTKENAIWSLFNFNNTYNAMLSVTVLPSILSLFVNINGSFILKLCYPLVFTFVPLIVYLTTKNYFNSIICFLASFFFMLQYTFFNWYSIPIRQEIAFLFFGLIFLVLLTKNIKPHIKKLFFVIFGFSMIVSHYSTSYIALAIFFLTYMLIFLSQKYENRKIKKEKLNSKNRQKFNLTGILLFLLLIFGFLWYSQITPTADGLIDFAGKSISNLGNMFSEDVQAEGQSSLLQFSIFKHANYYDELQDYNKEIVKSYVQTGTYNETNYKSYTPNIMVSKSISYKLNMKIVNFLTYFGESLKIFLGKILIIFGSLFLLLNLGLRKRCKEYSMIMLTSLSILCLIVVLPFTTISYDLMRTYQQILILLSVSTIFGLLFIFNYFKKEKYVLISIFLIIYFLFLSGFIVQLVGGYNPSIRMNNIGIEYNTLYAHNSEYFSGLWLVSRNNLLNPIHIDSRAGIKLYLSGIRLRLLGDILPSTIGLKNYVYSDYSNVHEQIAFKSFRGSLLPFNFPTEFLNDNKNKIYNNGGSEIFK